MDYQAIKDCIMQTVDGESRPHEGLAKYACRVSKSMRGVSVQCFMSIMDKATQPENAIAVHYDSAPHVLEMYLLSALCFMSF